MAKVTFEKPGTPQYTTVLRVLLYDRLAGHIYESQAGYYFYIPKGKPVTHTDPEVQMFSTLEACKTDVAGE